MHAHPVRNYVREGKCLECSSKYFRGSCPFGFEIMECERFCAKGIVSNLINGVNIRVTGILGLLGIITCDFCCNRRTNHKLSTGNAAAQLRFLTLTLTTHEFSEKYVYTAFLVRAPCRGFDF